MQVTPSSYACKRTSMNGQDEVQTPLLTMAEEFETLSDLVKSRRPASENQLGLSVFCEACSCVSILFGCLGLAFKFAELEFVSKIGNLTEASKRFNTIQIMIDRDVANGTVRTSGSNSRNLRRVKQGLDLVRALFEEFLTSDDHSLKEAASTAYAEVCAPYHSWAVRTAVYAGMCALPTREQLLHKLNETDYSAEKKMRRYIMASRPVVQFIDELFTSRNIPLDW